MAKRSNGREPLAVKTHRQPSEDAVVAAAANMLRLLDRERGACDITRITNGKEWTAVFELREGPTSGDRVTFADRMAELDRMEDALEAGLSETQFARAKELADVQS